MKILPILSMSTKFNKNIVTLFLSSMSVSAFAQDKKTFGALITDRPDQTESPTPMPKGFLQVETGAFYETFEDNSIKNENYTFYININGKSKFNFDEYTEKYPNLKKCGKH